MLNLGAKDRLNCYTLLAPPHSSSLPPQAEDAVLIAGLPTNVSTQKLAESSRCAADHWGKRAQSPARRTKRWVGAHQHHCPHRWPLCGISLQSEWLTPPPGASSASLPSSYRHCPTNVRASGSRAVCVALYWAAAGRMAPLPPQDLEG